MTWELDVILVDGKRADIVESTRENKRTLKYYWHKKSKNIEVPGNYELLKRKFPWSIIP